MATKTKPTADNPDAVVINLSSIVLLQPYSEAAKAWCAENIAPDAQWHAGAVAVEPRYVGDIVDGLQADGYTVEGR